MCLKSLFLVTTATMLASTFTVFAAEPDPAAGRFDVSLRTRTLEPDGWVRIRTRNEDWQPGATAIIVCDMWDAHHCLNAVRRVQQLAPRIDHLLRDARQRGATIIHAPSSCLDFYQSHPARQNVLRIAKTKNAPDGIQSWCDWKDAKEQQVGYPIDDTDGGEDDDPIEHRQWRGQLTARGLDPNSPWKRQIETIHIDDADYVTDDGVETWSILEHHAIQNVMLVGVHTNMCVLGRPFGLRQLAKNGKNVVLVRDLTDTMYNPAMRPFVSHFSGTDLIVEHIEQHVCPTISSDQIVSGEPFQFRNDLRPHIVMLIGEQEYETRITLPAFAKQHLYRDYRVSYVFADPDAPNHFPDMQLVSTADLLLVSVRRRTPPIEQLAIVRSYVESGKPVIGIRTASHAFALREGEPADGYAAWPEFDAEVFGGNYQGHHGNKSQADESSFVWSVAEATEIPGAQTSQVPTERLTTSWLYKTSPLRPGTRVLMRGRVGDRKPDEPVSWTYVRGGGGRTFYTSLGHRDDFADPDFQSMLRNAVVGSLGVQRASR